MLLIICVNYNNDDETAFFLMQVLKQHNSNVLNIVLVNNGDYINKQLSDLCDNQQSIKFYQADNNLGYFGAARWGMKQYLKEFSMPEWVIVSNTDIQFPDPNLINKIVNYQLDSTAAIIAPKIIKQTLNGLILENQNPFLKKRPSKTKMLFYVFKNRFFIFAVLYGVLAKFKSEVWSAYRKKEGSCNWMNKEKVCEEIYAPMGAFIIFNRRYFDAGGTLYHEPFLYGEEISIAEEARKLKLKTIYDPNLKITHLAGGTSGNVPSKTRVNYQYQGVRYCYDKYFKSK